MATERKPIQVFCLVEHLVDEMEARGWTTSDIARRIGRDYGRDKLMIDLIFAVTPTEDNCLIGDETFSDLARVFDISEDFFRNLHAQWIDNPDARSPYEAPEYIFDSGVES